MNNEINNNNYTNNNIEDIDDSHNIPNELSNNEYSMLNIYGIDDIFGKIFNRFTRVNATNYGNTYENIYNNNYAPLYEPFETNNKINLIYTILLMFVIYKVIY